MARWYLAVVLSTAAAPWATADDAIAKLLAAGRYREGIEAAREALAARPEDAELWHRLGGALVSTGEVDEARHAFDRALELGASGRIEIEVAIARLEARHGAPSKAHSAVRRLLEAPPDAPRSVADLEALASAARLLGEVDSSMHRTALRLYEEVLQRTPENLSALVSLGHLLLDKYNNAEALELFREALAIDDTDVPALLGLARSQHFDRSPDALETIRRSLEIRPHQVAARVLLARLHIDAEEYADAQRELDTALAVNPGSAEALTLAAAVQLLSGDRVAFHGLVREVRRLAPGYLDLYVTLAEIAAQNRRYEEAAGFAMTAIAIDERAWRAHGLLGINRLRTGAIAAGRNSLEVAFRGDPYNVWFKNTLDLLDRLDEFESVRSSRFELVADPGEIAVLAPHLLPLAEAAYDYYAARYRHYPSTPVRIEVFPRHEDFSVRTVGLVGVDILGVSFGPVVALDSPSAGTVGPINWGSILWHEIAHTFHLDMSDHRVPRWFTEGLSVHEEHLARPGWGADVNPAFLAAFHAGELPRASQINQVFLRPSEPGQVAHAYYQSSLLIALIERDYGVDALRAMLAGYRDGATTQDLIGEALGTTPEALDAAFADFVRERFGHAIEATVGAGDTGADDDYASLLELGREAMEAGDLDRAEAALRRAQDRFPEYAHDKSAYHALAALYERQGEVERAISQLRRLIDINADDLDAHLKLAELLRLAGEDAEAAATLERAIFIQPLDVAMHQQLAEIYERAGDWDLSARARLAVVSLDPVDPVQARYRLAKAMHEGGEGQSARSEVLRALEAAPVYEEALELLLEIRQGIIERR